MGTKGPGHLFDRRDFFWGGIWEGEGDKVFFTYPHLAPTKEISCQNPAIISLHFG